MKIEDLHYTAKDDLVDEKTWDIEKWREENPMDYFLALYILQQANAPEEVSELFKTIYKVMGNCFEMAHSFGGLTLFSFAYKMKL